MQTIDVKERIPEMVLAVELGGLRTALAVPMLKESELIVRVRPMSAGSSSLHGQTDRAGAKFRRSSCHRYRECAIAKGAARENRRGGDAETNNSNSASLTK
jgi:hypothetical protein